MNHMIDNNLLSDKQHGFIQGRSCTTQLFKVMDKWTEIMEAGGDMDIIYLDLSKAFDSVPHERLLIKLEAYGVAGDVLEWISQFLRQKAKSGGSGFSVRMG